MISTRSGSAGNYRRIKSPNGAGMTAGQMARVESAGKEIQRRQQQEAAQADAAERSGTNPFGSEVVIMEAPL